MPRPSAATDPRWTESRLVFGVCAALVIAVFLVYAYAFQCEFLDFDDKSHITKNDCVLAGFCWSSVCYAFTHFIAAQWIPLTWLSHMADVSLFGVDPAWHHLGNVVLHAANACLVFVVLRRMTGEFWPSVTVAALFALHPVNVESVAWIAERKNVLSTLFWLLAMWAYVRHVERPNGRWMWAVAGCMLLGYLAKPVLVTLPCALLLLDAWPLRRAERLSWWKLVVEKIPLFLLAAVASATTLGAAAHYHALTKSAQFTIGSRLANAATGYVAYLSELFWPTRLAPLYPLQESYPAAQLIGAAVVLASITIGTVILRKRMPYLLIGWLWFLGVLAPVSGVFQVGLQAYADRFTYIPQLGIFWAVVWAARELPQRAARWLPVAAGAVAMLLAGLTVRQVRYWHDTATLFEYTLSVTHENGIAQSLVGMGLARRGDYPEAIAHYRTAMHYLPQNAELHARLGEALSHTGDYPSAIEQFRISYALEPSDERTKHNLVILLVRTGAFAEATRLVQH